MLDTIRTNARSFGVKLIFGIIILVFVFWGVGNFNKGGGHYVAEVNGEPLSAEDFGKLYVQARQNEQRNNPRLTFTDEVDSKLKAFVLEQMIERTVLLQEAKRLGIVVTPHEIRKVISDIRLFQTNGTLDPKRYKDMLALQGLTPVSFESELRDDLMQEKMFQAIGASVGVTEAEARIFFNFALEQRKAEYVLFKASDYSGKVTVTEKDAEDAYTARRESFRREAEADIEFIPFTPATLAGRYAPSAEELKAEYDKNIARFTVPASFEGRQIFISAPAADAAALAKGREKASDVDKRISAGEDFADLARRFSDDPATAAVGGELGRVNLDTAPEFVRKAVEGLEKGKTAGPIVTDGGFYFIKLESKEAARTRAFDEVKNELAQTLGESRAAAAVMDLRREVEKNLAEGKSFADIAAAYNISVDRTGLKPVAAAAAAVNVSEESKKILEDAIASSAVAPAATNSTAPSAAPSPVALPVPLSVSNGFALVKIMESRPDRILNFAEVKDEVIASLKAEKAGQAAEEAAKAALASFSGPDLPAEYKGRVQSSGEFSRMYSIIPQLGDAPALTEALNSAGKGQWLPNAYRVKDGAVIARVTDIIAPKEEDWKEGKDLFIGDLLKRKRTESLQAFMGKIYEKASIVRDEEIMRAVRLR